MVDRSLDELIAANRGSGGGGGGKGRRKGGGGGGGSNLAAGRSGVTCPWDTEALQGNEDEKFWLHDDRAGEGPRADTDTPWLDEKGSRTGSRRKGGGDGMDFSRRKGGGDDMDFSRRKGGGDDRDFSRRKGGGDDMDFGWGASRGKGGKGRDRVDPYAGKGGGRREPAGFAKGNSEGKWKHDLFSGGGHDDRGFTNYDLFSGGGHDDRGFSPKRKGKGKGMRRNW